MAYLPGYVLHWREQGLDWSEVQIPSEKTNHKFTGLNCGTSYKFYITAFNSMGKGQPSDVISATTEGSGILNLLCSLKKKKFSISIDWWNCGMCTWNLPKMLLVS